MNVERRIPKVLMVVSLALLLLVPAGSGAQTEPGRLSDVKVTSQKDSVTVFVKTSREPHYTADLVDSPTRLVVDLEDTVYAWRKTPLTVGKEPLRQIRGGQYRQGIARVVLDLSRTVGYAIREEPNGLAIVIPTAPAAAKSAAAEPVVATAKPAATKPVATPAPKPQVTAALAVKPETPKAEAAKPETPKAEAVRPDPMQQPSERPRAAIEALAMISVDVLPDQRDLAHAGVGEALRFGDDLGDRPRRLGAACVWHHAEGAKLVAAFLHCHERRYAASARRVSARRSEHIELVFDRELGVDRALTALGPCEQRGQPMIALRSHDEIDRWRAADDLFAFGLGHAACHRNGDTAPLARRCLLDQPHATQLRIDLLGRLLADMAGVEDDEVGILGSCGLGEAFGRERVRHTMRIVDVHLAAE